MFYDFSLNSLEPSQLNGDLYVKNYLLVLIFIVGGIYLVKEYLEAVRIADKKEVIFAVNTFLLKYSIVFLSFQ